MIREHDLDWSLGYVEENGALPNEWIEAQVPGNVQLDWARAKAWPDWWVGNNFRDYQWMEDVEWLYRTSLPEINEDSWGVLTFEAIDYQASVSIDGEVIAQHEGAYHPLILQLGPRPSGELQVRILPAPTLQERHDGRLRNTQSTKAGMFFGWDFAPRLVPSGLYGKVRFRTGQAVLIDWSVQAALNGSDGVIRVQTSWCGTPYGRLTVRDPNGTIIASTEVDSSNPIELNIANPERWWPNGLGPQYLYCVEIAYGETKEQKQCGFRTIQLVPYQGQWDEFEPFPLSRKDPPITLQVNGRPIFAKGANWVPPDQLPALSTKERIADLLNQVASANMNILRVWGGGGVPPEAFFDLCDELGILVWQEFPLACARYEANPSYLAQLEREARAIVARLRGRACLALWCGGNELFNAWSRMTDQDLPLRLLNKICYEDDPATPFLMTSPVMGMAHGGYTFQDRLGREVHEVFGSARATAYTEFGSGGPADINTLRLFMNDDDLWPPEVGTVWETHCGVKAWDGDPDSWLMRSLIEKYFGIQTNLECLLDNGSLMQAEAMAFIYQEARRQSPRCAMALCWCLNEPWPTAADNSLISWPSHPKPAFDAAKKSCRPRFASLKTPRWGHRQGSVFEGELWFLDDTDQPRPAMVLEYGIDVDGQKTTLGSWTLDPAAQGKNVRGPKITWIVSTKSNLLRFWIMDRDPESDHSSEVRFAVLPAQSP
jgi:beta-mannosidase